MDACINTPDLSDGVARRRPSGGFTLVEILAVISIIAVLAGIAIAVYGRAVSSANENRTKALMARIVMGLESYKGDYDAYIPCDSIIGDNASTTPFRSSSDLLYDRLNAEYLTDFPSEHIVSNDYYTDAWDLEFIYLHWSSPSKVPNVAPDARPGMAWDRTYELWSSGPDEDFQVSSDGSSTLRPADEADVDADNIEAKRTAR